MFFRRDSDIFRKLGKEKEMQTRDVVVRGAVRRVFYDPTSTKSGGYVARLRAPRTGNSIRGMLKRTSVGWRFYPSNRDSLNAL